jgi:hypothetical protein
MEILNRRLPNNETDPLSLRNYTRQKWRIGGNCKSGYGERMEKSISTKHAKRGVLINT